MTNYTCSICGSVEEKEHRSLDAPDKNFCFTCWFWRPKIKAAKNNDQYAVRVDGVHYYIHPDSKGGNRAFSGFGGSRFDIRFHDGRLVTTHNLWCQGDIPERFRDVLPDNAIFIQETSE